MPMYILSLDQNEAKKLKYQSCQFGSQRQDVHSYLHLPHQDKSPSDTHLRIHHPAGRVCTACIVEAPPRHIRYT